MVIHVVRPGETLTSVAQEYGVPLSLLLNLNQPSDPNRLAVGQTLVVRFPAQVHTVQQGQSLLSIARQYGLTLRQLWRNNPILGGGERLDPGQTLVISYRDEPDRGALVNAYAYPFIDSALLQSTLPFLSYLTPFTYGFTPAGQLVDLRDAGLLQAAAQAGVTPLLHLSTLTEQGNFSNELAGQALNDPAVQRTLIDDLAAVVEAKGYQGVDVDFEYLLPQDALSYAAFIRRLTQVFVPLPVVTALAPKISAAQPGLLYEGHDYGALGTAADYVLLMTYEWGYTYGPPMAVAPLPNVRQVVEYALTEIPAKKIWLGIPAYGYDWTLPFVQGASRAVSISCQYAVELALEHGAQIQFDAYAQSPWFNYRDRDGREHQVWFEDARSIQAKLALLADYGLRGTGYWNLMRPFPQNWQVLDAMYRIEDAGGL